MKTLEFPDSTHLTWALGWLELGSLAEAEEEIWKVSPANRHHPDVLHVRYGIYARGKQWRVAAKIAQALCKVLPDRPLGWVHRAYALHQMARTQESWDVLRQVAERFPNEYIVPYDLACYACQLGHLPEALDWIKRSAQLAGFKKIKEMALGDSDLEPLWKQFG
jgi:predicted Zn-dependent protease